MWDGLQEVRLIGLYGVGSLEAHYVRTVVFIHHTRLVLADDTRIKFLSDLWCENNALKDAFSSFFWLTSDK